MTREPEYTNPVSFTLTVEQSATLRAYVEVNKISLADVVRECLERGLGIPDPAGRLQGHCTAVSEAGPISVVPRPGRGRSWLTARRGADGGGAGAGAGGGRRPRRGGGRR